MRKTDASFCLMETVTLSTSFIPFIILHFSYVFMQNVLIFVATLSPSPQTLCLSHTHSLSVSPVVRLSSPLSPSHIKMHGNHFWIIIDYNKVLWQTLLFYFKRAEHNKSLVHTWFIFIDPGVEWCHLCITWPIV